MKKTGDMLKKARQEKGLSLHEIGLSLKINSKVLKAIEDGDPEGLPAKTFLRGFVQSYAQYLRLNNDEIMALFTEEMGSTRPSPLVKSLDPDAPLNLQPEKASSSSDSSPLENPKLYQSNEFKIKPFLYGFVILVLVGLIYMVKKVVDRYQREAITEAVRVENPLPEPPSPPSQAASSAATSTASLTQTAKPVEIPPLETAPSNVLKLAIPPAVTPEKKPDTEMKAVESRIEVKPSEAKNTEAKIPEPKPHEIKSAAPKSPETKPLPDKLPEVKVVEVKVKPETKRDAKPTEAKIAESKPAESKPAESKPAQTQPTEPSSEVSVKVPGAPSDTLSAAKKNEAKPGAKVEEKVKAKPVELIVEAMDAVEIEYSSLSGKSGKLKLAADQVHTFKSSSGLKLNIDNGGAVNLILNGKDIGVPGSLGKPLRLSY